MSDFRARAEKLRAAIYKSGHPYREVDAIAAALERVRRETLLEALDETKRFKEKWKALGAADEAQMERAYRFVVAAAGDIEDRISALAAPGEGEK